MSYVLALDQGTTSCRAILYNHEGAVLAVAQREFQQFYPQPGWVEHDAEEIWGTQVSVAIEALSRGHARARDIVALGITDQRETTVVWERKTGKPVCNAIVWQDRRTAGICNDLREQGLESMVRTKTGLLVDAYFSATKIMWILDNVEGAREKANAGELAFGTIDSWLIWNLTSGQHHWMDVTNASRTMLFNIRDCRWDAELLGAMNIPESLLPRVCPSSGVVAQVSTSLGLADIPIAGVAGDQQAALFGQACFRPGMAKCTYGTGAFLLQNIGTVPKSSDNRLLTTIAWQLDRRVEYALEGSIFVAGSVVQWLRDGLGIIKASDEVERLAAEVPDNGDVYLVPAFTGLGAPHWDPYARGTLIGLTRGTKAGHIARAALESIAFQVTDLIGAIEQDSGITIKELRVDGGASANNLLMQFQADLLRIPVIRPALTETTCLGAAYLAGLAVGFWKDRNEIEAHWKVDQIFEPKRPKSEMDDWKGRWSQALERSKDWANPNARSKFTTTV